MYYSSRKVSLETSLETLDLIINVNITQGTPVFKYFKLNLSLQAVD